MFLIWLAAVEDCCQIWLAAAAAAAAIAADIRRSASEADDLAASLCGAEISGLDAASSTAVSDSSLAGCSPKPGFLWKDGPDLLTW
jgi:hypothetical protein